ncbi:MAG: metallopeptidase family protein [Candidatus Bipolaricaulia bacterium]
MTAMTREQFEKLVDRAVEDLPPLFKERIENVAIIVQDRPDPEIAREFPGGLLLGLYRGVPKPKRSVWGNYPYPDMIYIYQRNIEAICRSDEEMVEQIRNTVIHEIGHHFGLSDEEMEV